jgi:hypothetical protein
MSGLTNSLRSVLKATYVPTRSTSNTGAKTTRAVEKTAMLRQMNIQPAEFTALQQVPKLQAHTVNASKLKSNARTQAVPTLIDLAQRLSQDNSINATTNSAPLLAGVTHQQLNDLSQEVAKLRSQAAKTGAASWKNLQGAYKKAFPKTTSASDQQVWDWGISATNVDAVKIQSLATVHLPYSLANMMNGPAAAGLQGSLDSAAQTASAIANDFLSRFQVEPVGRLHLERIEMTPVGIEHGELVHSVPLTPQETVNISHREWSTTTQTFENIVSDSLTGFSEEGVVDKTDIAQAAINESRQQSSLDVNGNVSASYTGAGFSVTASTGIDYNTHSDDFKSVKDSLAHSVAVTRSASSRSRKDHRTSFRVSSVAGTENLAVQVLTNPTNNAVRVDYFQLMRKWQVDLIRYGLRMTYDIVLPNPGNALIGRLAQLDALKTQIAADHVFAITLDQITPTSWKVLEQQFSVSLPSPPADPFEAMQSGTLSDSVDKFAFVPVDVELPDGYEVTGGHFHARVHVGGGGDHKAQVSVTGEAPSAGTWPLDAAGQFQDADGVLEVDLTNASIVGRSGKVSIMINHYNVDTGGWLLKVQASPTQDAIDSWQSSILNKLRDADNSLYQSHLQKLNEQAAAIKAELGAFDALTLRRMEREEIMRGLLQWLFGPSFQIQPGVLDQYLDNPEQSVFQTGNSEAWQIVMQYGEYIKYIHNAIEWENVLFFPYPYFWDSSTRWPFKLFLMHPDPEHRSFLRAGCARVVLTIRPGFEQSFAQFMENYSLTTLLASDHPYVTIGTEIRNFAMTNYEAIPPANPDKNVRPLLYPEQRKAWLDMQKLIQLIEAYNTDKHTVQLTTAVAAGTNTTATPSSMDGIDYGTTLLIDTDANQETLMVLAVTATTFSANFSKAHAAATSVVIDSDVKLYPASLNVLKTYAGTNNLPLKDPWGSPFVYTYPGLHGDYDLVSYGKDGAEGGDDLSADITSWAEGSVVSTWFEYTPTSALDVVINTALTTTAVPA